MVAPAGERSLIHIMNIPSTTPSLLPTLHTGNPEPLGIHRGRTHKQLMAQAHASSDEASSADNIKLTKRLPLDDNAQQSVIGQILESKVCISVL